MNRHSLWPSPLEELKIPTLPSDSVFGTGLTPTPTNAEPVTFRSPPAELAAPIHSLRVARESSASFRTSPGLSGYGIEVSSKVRPCLAGTQSAKRFATMAGNFTGNTSLETGSPSPARQTHPGVNEHSYDSSGFGSISDSSGSALNASGLLNSQLSQHSSSFEQQEMSVAQLFEQMHQVKRWESQTKRESLHRSPNDLSTQLNQHDGGQKTALSYRSRDYTAEKPTTPDLRIHSTGSPLTRLTTAELNFSTPATVTSTGCDNQVLEENLASVARYVEELTGCGTGRNSVASNFIEGGGEQLVDLDAETEQLKSKIERMLACGGVQSFEEYDRRDVYGTTQRPPVIGQPKPHRSSPESMHNEQPNDSGRKFQNDHLLNAFTSTTNSLLSTLPDDCKNFQANELLPLLLNLVDTQPHPTTSAFTTPPFVPDRFPSTYTTTDNYQPQLNRTRTLKPAPTIDQTQPLGTAQVLPNALLSTLACFSPATLVTLISYLTNTSIGATNKSSQQSISANANALTALANLLAGSQDANPPALVENVSTMAALAAVLDSTQGPPQQRHIAAGSSRTFVDTQSQSSFGSLRGSPVPSTWNECQAASSTGRLNEELAQLVVPYCSLLSNVENDIERAANIYRNSANSAAQNCDAIYQWIGKLPTRNYKSMSFSRKVFLGGVPWDSNSEDLLYVFSQFGNVSVVWPQREGLPGGTSHSAHYRTSTPKGYCYLVFDHESSVNELLSRCLRDLTTNGDYFKISSPKFKSKDVQVIPWVVGDSQYSRAWPHRLDANRTVFIGALHGMITAEALATIMNDLFGNVIFAALDTDKYKYPIGSGRAVFSSHKSYMKAVTANFVEVRTPKFTKTVQIDPYLEDSPCNSCLINPGIYFCRAFQCFQYFCPTCWQLWHNSTEALVNHKPLRRSLKPIPERR